MQLARKAAVAVHPKTMEEGGRVLAHSTTQGQKLLFMEKSWQRRRNYI